MNVVISAVSATIVGCLVAWAAHRWLNRAVYRKLAKKPWVFLEDPPPSSSMVMASFEEVGHMEWDGRIRCTTDISCHELLFFGGEEPQKVYRRLRTDGTPVI